MEFDKNVAKILIEFFSFYGNEFNPTIKGISVNNDGRYKILLKNNNFQI